MIRLVVAGANGQTGGAVFSAAEKDKQLNLVGGIAEQEDKARKIYTLLSDVPDADVLIDFTTADAASSLIRQASEKGLAVVSGTTGLSDKQEEAVRQASETVPVVRSGNFSLGVNMLLALVEQAAAKLDGFDIEVTETHHRRKVDAPSGTALMLGKAAAKGRQTDLSANGVFARHGQTGVRAKEDIGFSVIRGGGVPGDHTVSYLSESEIVTISHRALDRRLFAEGALKAAQWVHGKSPGLYSMKDVLGLI